MVGRGTVGQSSGTIRLRRRATTSNGQVAERAGLAVGTDVAVGSIPTKPAVQYIFLRRPIFYLEVGILPVNAMPKS